MKLSRREVVTNQGRIWISASPSRRLRASARTRRRRSASRAMSATSRGQIASPIETLGPTSLSSLRSIAEHLRSRECARARRAAASPMRTITAPSGRPRGLYALRMRGAVAAGNRHTAEAGAWALDAGWERGRCGRRRRAGRVRRRRAADRPCRRRLPAPARRRRRADRCSTASSQSRHGRAAPMDEVVIDFGDASTQVFHAARAPSPCPASSPGSREAHERHGRLPWRSSSRPRSSSPATGVEMTGPQRFLLEILVPILERTDEGTEHLRLACPRRDRGDGPGARALARRRRRRRCRARARLSPRTSRVRGDRAVTARGGVPRDARRHLPTAVARGRRRRRWARRARRLDARRRRAALAGRAGAMRSVHGYGGSAAPRPLTGTTHVSVIDGDGNAAALSSTLGSGSGVFSSGFQLNNMLGELDVIGSRAAAAGRAAAEHDGADARPRRRRATARRRQRRVGRLSGAILQIDPPRRRRTASVSTRRSITPGFTSRTESCRSRAVGPRGRRSGCRSRGAGERVGRRGTSTSAASRPSSGVTTAARGRR